MSIISTFPEKKGLNLDDINDIASGEISNGFVQSQFNYSTEEQVVGKWVNGKPLYQKTFVDTLPTNTTASANGRKYISIGATVDEAFLISADTTTNGTVLPMYNTNSALSFFVRVMIVTNHAADNKNTIAFDLMKGAQSWNGLPCKATIQYTKTTD